MSTSGFEHPEQTLQALVHELRQPLCTIARRAELNDDNTADEILGIAERSLVLIDSYLLMAQTEYGQLALDLVPAGLGSILHDVSEKLQSRFPTAEKVLIENNANALVMTHRPALASALVSIAEVLAGISPSEDRTAEPMVLRSYKSRAGGIGIGIFNSRNFSSKDIRDALVLHGTARMPLARAGSRAGVSLVIADSLCRAIGGTLEVKRQGNLTGLATILPKSEQLSFV